MAPRMLILPLLLLCEVSLVHGNTPRNSHVPPEDSTRVYRVLPGVYHTEYQLPGPFVLHVVSMDLTRSGYSLQSYRPDSLMRTSAQVAMQKRNGKNVVAAVNADFFSFTTHWPVGNQIVEGVPVTGLVSNRSHMSVTQNGTVSFGPASFSSVLLIDGKNVCTIDGLNTHSADAIVRLFNGFWGDSTRTTGSATDIILKIAGGTWNIGDTTDVVVTHVNDAGNSSLKDSDAVLSFPDSLFSIKENDTLRIVIAYGDHGKGIRTMIGGAGRLLVNGDMPSESNRESEKIGSRFMSDRHPRSFVAIDKDTSRFFMCTVDGRQQASIGMSFQEMADFLKNIGAWNAINLDGGGSTTMIVKGEIVNAPSDLLGERRVANTLMIVQDRRK